MAKKCITCGFEGDPEEFVKDRNLCKECNKARCKSRYSATKSDKRKCKQCNDIKDPSDFPSIQPYCTYCTEYKKCKQCGEEKHVSQFSKCGTDRYGVQRIRLVCIGCPMNNNKKDFKKCTRCKEELPICDFGNMKTSCKKCLNNDVKPTTKTCVDCKDEKNKEDFPHNRSRCKICYNKYKKENVNLPMPVKISDEQTIKQCMDCKEEKTYDEMSTLKKEDIELIIPDLNTRKYKLDKSYIAGLFDGDASIWLDSKYVRVEIIQCNPIVLHEIMRVYCGNIRKCNARKDNQRVQWKLSWFHKKALVILEILRDYSIIEHNKADLCIKYILQPSKDTFEKIKECSKKRNGVRMYDRINEAYISGLVDAEGSIYSTYQENIERIRYGITITQKNDPELLIHISEYLKYGKTKSVIRLTFFNKKDILQLIETMLPYVYVKYKQMHIMRDLLNSKDIKYKQNLVIMMSSENHFNYE